MPDVYRLGPRAELWSPDLIDRLAGRSCFVVGSDPALLDTLLAKGISAESSISEGSVLIVPMTPIEELVLLVQRLRGPGGCPWDQVQTHESLKRCLLEETYEVFDAIDSGDDAKLKEELGDLLLQPIMHGEIAMSFGPQDAARAIVDKLIHRHPHVFGEVTVSDSDEVLQNWDRIKAAEKGTPQSILAGVPSAMASLLRAYEVSKRAARSGFEWPSLEAVWDKLHEEEAELREALASGDADAIESEVGDLLFTAVNIARWAKVEPEEALRRMVNRFTERFQAMEQAAGRPLSELDLETWDQLWEAAKTKTAS